MDGNMKFYAKNYVYRLIFSTVRPNFIENMSNAMYFGCNILSI